MHPARLGLALFLLALLGLAGLSTAQPPKPPDPQAKAGDPDPEEERDRAVAERFRRVLEGNPRRGTALDRLYGYHVERGTLDQLVAEYTARTAKDAKDGVAWMIVGLLESQRGRDAAAVAAFRQAETNLSGNAIPPYYLGQSLILVGQPDAAAEAFERSIRGQPNRNDLLDIFQALGRVYQRAQRTEKALDVWNRLEKLFPDDARVQEQIATTLVEEGQFEQALPRLVKLAEKSDDKYRQTTLRMDVADLKVKLKRTPEALADFEKLVADLNPDSWLYRDVRRRTEEVFLRNDDMAGLAKYYEAWLGKHATDVDAIARLAKTLSTQGRAPEARDWLAKGVAAAPTNRGLRQALLDQYVAEQNFAAAAREYEAMDKADPNNPDTLREWGRLLMRDAGKPEAERRAAAAEIWKRLLAKKPNDAVVASQVADLMRTAGATDDAIALYKKAIELAPNAAQYREYLGEYFHSLQRSDEALATWRPIADGANRNSKNLARLAEVFAGFGYRKEAVGAMADAVSLEKDDFTLLMTYAELLHQESRHTDALSQIASAAKLTSNAEEAEQILNAQIKVYQATEALGDRIEELQKELATGRDATAERWLRLARLYEANRQADKANETIAKALEKDPRSIPVSVAAARIYEAGGNILAASDVNRKLAGLDRRYRSEYLTAVTKLEQRLGRRDQALQAARDLLAASPGNPEVYKFFADLCFQLGDQEEGLEALRRSVRANPSDPQVLITLANALGERVRQGEAIELLWRAFEKTNELDAKLGVVDRLTQLYLESNQFDRLLERLERERREADKAREATLCIAQAFTTAGDLGTARQQLERLLTENTRDTHLLGQLSTLCEQEGDLAAAVKYQRQLTAAAPNNYDHHLKMAQLLTRSGEADEAADIWVRLVSKDTEPHRNLASIDQLLTAGKHEAALAILARMLAQKPGNWELLYREGAALAARNKTDEARARFAAVLGLRLPDDDMGEIAKQRQKDAKKKATAANPTTIYNQYGGASRIDEWAIAPLTRRANNIYTMRNAIGMDPQNYYRGQPQLFYAPSDFGEARMACLGWLYEFGRQTDGGDAYVKQLRDTRDKAGNDPRPMWDWYYLHLLRHESKQQLVAATTLANGADPAGLLAYLNALASRGNANQRYRRMSDESKDVTPPLPADQLANVLAAFGKLKQLRPEWASSDVVRTVMTEMKRAGREAEGKTFYQDLLKDAVTVSRTQDALALAAERNDLDATLDLFNRLEKLQPPAKTTATLGQLPTRQASYSLVPLMGKRADEKKYGDVRKVLDVYLASARRQNLMAAKSASSRRPQTGGLSVMTYAKGGNSNQAQIKYPSPNEYFDATMLTQLYNVYDLHKRGDLVSDLLTHLQGQLGAAQGAERLYVQLALGYVHWWAGDKDDALARLSEAIQTAPGDHGLLLEVAALREQNNEFDAALAMLDSFTPLETSVMQRREEAALRLAERAGNVDRARQAAERLFGLRLDSDKQLDLAGKMHRLGMSDLAETVLNRAQRQAGGKTATLARLMIQYQNQNQGDLAVLIARQILRRGPSTPNPNRGVDENDSARSQAVGVLARSGNLKEMIERAEAQLKASPKSTQIGQALVNYYQAAGDKAKLKDAVLRLAETKPDDGKLRFQAAQQLQQMGERDAALTEYARAIRLEPSLLAHRYWEIQNLFGQARKLDELAKLLDEIDFRKVGQYYSVVQPIANLMQQPETKAIGLKLFKKAWEAFPQYRAYMLGNLYNEDVWRLPEIYDFARQAVIPRDDGDVDPWQAASDVMSYSGDGRLETVVSRMLSIARKQQRLPELRAEIEAAVKKQPDWSAGKILLAIIDVQTGAKEEGRRRWQEVFNDPKADVPPVARFILCQELEFYAGVEDLAIKTMEAGIEDIIRDGSLDFSDGPARRLIWWYEQLGRKEDARKLLMRFAKGEAVDPGYGGGYWQYRIVMGGISVAQELVRTGDPIEAVRIYNQVLADKDALEQARQYGGDEPFDRMVEMGLRAAVKEIKPSVLPSAVATLLTPRANPAPDQPVLDLVILVESRELSKSVLTSLFASALKGTDKRPEVRKDAVGKLADLVAKYPNDISVQTAAVLAAFADGNLDAARRDVDRLVKLMDSTPLEPLPGSGKANARQRAEAALQIPLWLAARECLAKDREPFWPAGEKLAARAAAAAKRQQDLLQAIALLREWGQLELEHGARNLAEARWAELLELSLPKPAPAKGAGVPPPPPPAPAPSPAPIPSSLGAMPTALRGNEGNSLGSKDMPTQSRGHGIHPDAAVATLLLVAAQIPAPPVAAISSGQPLPPVVRPAAGTALTEDQFDRAYHVAVLAAENGLIDLSLRAVRDAVRNGPPLPSEGPQQGGRYMSRIINGTQYYVQGGNNVPKITVDQALLNLVPKWQAKDVPAAAIYDALIGAVLPDARPSEVFTYTETQFGGTLYVISSSGQLTPSTDVIDGAVEDRGLGRLLIEAALQAGKADDLRTRLEVRARQPLGELPAKILLALLAVQTRDVARAGPAIQALAERVKKDAQQGTNTAVSKALVPLLTDAKFGPLAAPVVEKTAENFATGGNQVNAAELRFKLAAYHLARKDEAAARAQFKAVDTFGKGIRVGDYDAHLPLAQQYLKAGWVDDALRELGLYVDQSTVAGAAPRGRIRTVEPTVGADFARLIALLMNMPAEKRYETLKAWSLPTAGRRSVRYVVDMTPKYVPPPAFGKQPPMDVNAVVSTMLLLADAAREAGKLDELTAEADRLAADKVENAQLLRILVYLSQGKGKQADAELMAYADAARQRLTARPPQQSGPMYYDEDDDSRQPAQIRPSEFLFVTLCLADPAVAAHGEALLPPMRTRAETINNVEYVSRIRAAQDRLAAAKAGAPAAAATDWLPPHWSNVTPRSHWFAQDGYLVQARNDQDSFLLLDAPLAGSFEFSVDTYAGSGHLGYGGVVYAPNQSMVWPVGRREQIQRPSQGFQGGEFNRLTVQVTPGMVRCLVNGQLFFEDADPPPTSPWLMLAAHAGSRPVFRNITVSGKPEVPAEVKLSGGDYLDGWMTHLYGGTVRPRLQFKEPVNNDVMDRYGNMMMREDGQPPPSPDTVYDWQAKDGEIQGRKFDRPADRPVPSKLSYFRPLQSGETLRYEFFYQPGKALTHPSLGRLAFLLEPDGVQLHWMTDRPNDDWTGLAVENAVAPPAGARGKLPLKAGDWNAVALTTTGDGVKIELNSTTVYEAKLPPEIERLFGFFHYRDRTTVRVRNVGLTGSWKPLGATDEVALGTKPAAPAEAKARRTMLGERYFATEAGAISARAKSLPARERYQKLADWVLPTESRPVFQLAGVVKPRDVLGIVDKQPQPVGRRVLLGGQWEIPCLEMVAAAKEAGLLDDLYQRLTNASFGADDGAFGRAKTALSAVVLAALGRDAEAEAAQRGLIPFAEQMPPFSPGPERWPLLIAVLGTSDRPAQLKPAHALAHAVNRKLDQALTAQTQFEDRDWWVRAFRAARAAIDLENLPKENRPANSANFAHWNAATSAQDNARGHGWGVPVWAMRDGALVHFPGHNQDYLILNTPLRGDFEVTCELKLKGWNGAHVVYGGHQFALGADRKKYRFHPTVRQGAPEINVAPPLPPPQPADGTRYQFRMVVKDGWLRALVDGQEVASVKIGPEPEPWLMLHAPHLNTGEVRNLRIVGSPTVPREINLLASDDLGMWRPYQQDQEWTKRGEEMYHEGRKPAPREDGKPLPPRGQPEAAFFYQRPIAEDGEVEYEFFYEPGKAHVAPTLDRLTFLLEPDGVKLHWLTDGHHDRGPVPFDNATDEPACRRGPTQLPLKARAWNKVRVAVAGDTIKVALNGVEVYERSIEATNQRTFGLFHFIDETEARVRSMVYRGAWPTQRPADELLFERKK